MANYIRYMRQVSTPPSAGEIWVLDPADSAASVLTWVDKQRKRKGDNLWTHATDDDLARIEACALIARET